MNINEFKKFYQLINKILTIILTQHLNSSSLVEIKTKTESNKNVLRHIEYSMVGRKTFFDVL